VLYSQDGDSIGRISFSIYESLKYDGLVLRKLNNMMTESQVHVRVCGRNRWTSKGTTIADVVIPMAVALKKTQAQLSFSLNYHIDVPVTPGETKIAQMNQSWEMKEGRHFTGRSLAWNMDLESETSQPQTLYKSPSVPDCSRKHRKHNSKAARFLKGEIKLFKGKHNDRYNKNSKHHGSQMLDSQGEGPSVGNPNTDEVEYIGSSSRKSTNTALDRRISELFEVSQPEVEEPTAPRPSLKYSRAFGEHSTGRRVTSYQQDVSIEDVDDDFEQEIGPTKTGTRVSRY